MANEGMMPFFEEKVRILIFYLKKHALSFIGQIVVLFDSNCPIIDLNWPRAYAE